MLSRSIALRALALLVLLPALTACGVSMPKIPFKSEEDDAPATPAPDLSATPRELMTAKLVNPRNDDVPNMTVGKLMEFADRYLACDCAGMRFGQAWSKTADGYRLKTSSGNVRPLEFACKDVGEARECFLEEIDRGPQTEALGERFVPGSEFIKFLYENGVKCERVEPCP